MSQILNQTLVLNDSDWWASELSLRAILDRVFFESQISEIVLQRLKSRPSSIETFFSSVRGVLESADFPRKQTSAGENLLEKLKSFEVEMIAGLRRLDPRSSPNPTSIYWPDPKRGQSLEATMPFVKAVPIISKNTAIGSAGSCFAVEVAYALQERKFNYIVTENLPTDRTAPVYVDPHRADSRYSAFSAQWGMIFNTASFRQLAERAFNVKPTRKILFESATSDGQKIFSDPFRENVYFSSREAYEANYESHTNAMRDVFLKSEVFICALGLNEMWHFANGGEAISQYPGAMIGRALLRHKVMTIEENIQNMKSFFEIIRAHNPKCKFIVSVSPVPFYATGLGQETHVVVANSHSKAVLRVVAEELVRSTKDSWYFPSYEVVTTCLSQPWAEDCRHVTPEAVSRVMEVFESMFVD